MTTDRLRPSLRRAAEGRRRPARDRRAGDGLGAGAAGVGHQLDGAVPRAAAERSVRRGPLHRGTFAPVAAGLSTTSPTISWRRQSSVWRFDGARWSGGATFGASQGRRTDPQLMFTPEATFVETTIDRLIGERDNRRVSLSRMTENRPLKPSTPGAISGSAGGRCSCSHRSACCSKRSTASRCGPISTFQTRPAA